MKVHNSQDYNLIRINSVKKTVREAMNKAATNFKSNSRPALWIFSDVLNGRVNLVQEIVAEAARLKFVVSSCFEYLFVGGKKKTHRFHLILERASLRTSAAGRLDNFPLLYC